MKPDITLNQNDSLLTAVELMMMLSISSTTLWRHVNNGDLPKPYYVGKSRYWKYSDIMISMTTVNNL